MPGRGCCTVGGAGALQLGAGRATVTGGSVTGAAVIAVVWGFRTANHGLERLARRATRRSARAWLSADLFAAWRLSSLLEVAAGHQMSGCGTMMASFIRVGGT